MERRTAQWKLSQLAWILVLAAMAPGAAADEPNLGSLLGSVGKLFGETQAQIQGLSGRQLCESPKPSLPRRVLSPACQNILNYTPPGSFPVSTLADLDQIGGEWPEPARTEFLKSGLSKRRRLIGRYYGLAPSNRADGLPLGLATDGKQVYVNCLICHAGKVYGQGVIGAPNSDLLLDRFVSDLSRNGRGGPEAMVKRGGFFLARSFLGRLSGSVGTNNAAGLTDILARARNPDLSPKLDLPGILSSLEKDPIPTNLQLKAAPWFGLGPGGKSKSHYYDASTGADHRHAMQFLMSTMNDGKGFEQLEPVAKQMMACIQSLKPPPYFKQQNPEQLQLARTAGHRVYERECAYCHGSHAPDGKRVSYSEDLLTVGTDSARMNLSKSFLGFYERSWFNRFGQSTLYPLGRGEGYVVPPLDGMGARAPFFHNGTVATVEDLLKSPQERAGYWRKRTDRIYDPFDSSTVQRLGSEAWRRTPPSERDRIYNTFMPGQSRRGHDFGTDLSPEQKRALTEFLKQL